jgi:hypothetical protein
MDLVCALGIVGSIFAAEYLRERNGGEARPIPAFVWVATVFLVGLPIIKEVVRTR